MDFKVIAFILNFILTCWPTTNFAFSLFHTVALFRLLVFGLGKDKEYEKDIQVLKLCSFDKLM